jgi:hypothetical protein
MKKDRKVNQGNRFVNSPIPEVLLRMSGCRDLLVNKAHTEIFGRHRFYLADSSKGFAKALAKREQVVRKAEDHQGSEVCYCEKINSAYALRGQYCPFETAFGSLVKTGCGQSRFGFFQIGNGNGTRHYIPYRIHATLFDARPTRRLMQCQILPLSGTSVYISGTTLNSGLPPKYVTCSVLMNGKLIFDEQKVNVPDDVGYRGFGQILSAISGSVKNRVGTLEEIKQNFLSAVKNLHDHVDYYPIRESVECLFSPGSFESVYGRIAEVRSKLFDALVLEGIEGEVERTVATTVGAFVEPCGFTRKSVAWKAAKESFIAGQALALSFSNQGGTPSGSTANGRNRNAFSPSPNGGVNMNNDSSFWKHSLDLYDERKAVVFPDRKERTRVLQSLVTDKAFVGMPRDYAGELVLIVPEPAIPLFRKRGFHFEVKDVNWKSNRF